MKEITVSELKQWQDDNKEFQLIDVREPFEAQVATLGGKLMPLGAILLHLGEINKEIPVVVHCRSGKRSADAIYQLEKHSFDNLYNLKRRHISVER